jgi:hypothetical protein
MPIAKLQNAEQLLCSMLCLHTARLLKPYCLLICCSCWHVGPCCGHSRL